MPYETDLECGEELAREIESGDITETDLTDSGRRKLALFRASSAADLEFLGFAVDKPQNS
jgi:hypothetical protein